MEGDVSQAPVRLEGYKTYLISMYMCLGLAIMFLISVNFWIGASTVGTLDLDAENMMVCL